MTFDSEDSEIYYIAEVGQPSSHPASGQRRMDNQIPGGGCWQRKRTSSEGRTRKQRYEEIKE